MRETPDAPLHQEFLLHDRKRIRNIKELYDLLDELTDDEFSHFVSGEKNDFAQWIEHSLNSKFLAARVRRCGTRADMKKVLFMELYL